MKMSLRYLILLVALLSVALTMISSISSGYRVNKQTLIDNTLETNRVYAQKVASTTDSYLKTTLQTLAYSANDIANDMKESDAKSLLAREAKRLQEQTNTFNSVIIVSATGKVLAASPETLDLVDKQIETEGAKQALAEKKPLISKPYTSMTKRLVIFISQPIFDGEGNYLGYVGGSIYLLEDNVLNELLGEHFYRDGSYVYVVDEEGRLLYHPSSARVGGKMIENAAITDIMNGNSGVQRITNEFDYDMLAGYAYMPTLKWGAISQRATEAALKPSVEMRKQMIIQTLPFLIISFILIIYISGRIAYPLQRLANYAKLSVSKNEQEEISDVRAFYYEAVQLENALVKSFDYLQEKVNHFIHQSTTDPLTGLVNRRTMDEQTAIWIAEGTMFSIILFDIDRFKRVNDTYGHAVGDEVLKFLAGEMRAVARKNDVYCRYGGEEFMLLLPETTMDEAFKIAEALRGKLESTISPSGEVVTISSGIASFPQCANHITTLIEIADCCLYEAKNQGRNKTIMADCGTND